MSYKEPHPYDIYRYEYTICTVYTYVYYVYSVDIVNCKTTSLNFL